MSKSLKYNVLAAFLVLLSGSLFAADEETVKGDLGYFYGYSFGNMLKEGRSADVDIDRLVQGLKDSLAETPPTLTMERQTAVLEELQKRQALARAEQEQAAATQQAADQAAAKDNLQRGVAFLAENAQRAEVQVTSSGLQFEIVEDEPGETAKLNSTVTVNYVGTFTDGEIFDQSRGAPVQFGLQQVISGWTEGLQLMSVGDRFRFYLHPDLAYGAGSVGQIPPNSVLIFDIELLEIK